MRKILVFGGGNIGMVIAKDLREDFEVTIGDLKDPGVEDTKWIQLDANAPLRIGREAQKYDLVIGALPSKLGFNAAKAVLGAEVPLVDISFCAEDLMELDTLAKMNNVYLLGDAGLAPGLTNLIAGHVNRKYSPKRIEVYVGGVSEDPCVPYGYIPTWNLDDLLAEYQRPARWRTKIRDLAEPVGDFICRESVASHEFEAFMTDGLRSLMAMSGPEYLSESTLRWPGHFARVEKYIEDGTLPEVLTNRCSAGNDMVALKVKYDDKCIESIIYAEDGITAMARSTAYSCTAMVRWALQKNINAGVLFPEHLPDECFNFTVQELKLRGIELEESSG